MRADTGGGRGGSDRRSSCDLEMGLGSPPVLLPSSPNPACSRATITTETQVFTKCGEKPQIQN